MKVIIPLLSSFAALSMSCMEQPVKVPNKQITIEYAAALWQNQTYKGYQEDTIACVQLPKRHFFGLFDGHLSNRSGNNVSTFLQENLHILFEQSKKETIKEKLEDAFLQAEIYALKNYIDGSTAVVAYIDEKQVLHLAWVGDSRAVLERNGKIVYETEDHNIHNLSELQRVRKHNLLIENPFIYSARSLEYGLAMSRSIGDILSKEVTPEEPLGIGAFIAIPEYHAIQLTPENNFLIIASDGLWFDVESTKAVEITTLLQNKPNLPLSILPKGQPDHFFSSPACTESITKAVRELGTGALVRGSQDNISIVIAQFIWQDMHKEKVEIKNCSSPTQ